MFQYLWKNLVLTTHMPFHAAIRVAMPMKNPMNDSTLHARPALLRVIRIAAMMPPTIPPTPRPRAKITRGRLPLQIVHRMKLGCAWHRRDHSTVVMTSLNADGWFV